MTSSSEFPQAPRQNNGCSLLVVIVTLMTVLIMVGVALFLPPFSIYDRLFGEQYALLQASGDSISTADGAFRIATITDTQGFGASVDVMGLVPFTQATAQTAEWIPSVRSAIPYYLALQSGVYQIKTNQQAFNALLLSVAMPTTASADVLDLYGYDAQRQTWEFIPSRLQNGRIEAVTSHNYAHVALFQPAPLPPKVVVEYNVTQFLTPEVATVADMVAPAGLQPTLTGALTGSLAPGFELNGAYAVMPVVRDYADPRALDTETVVAILGNSDLRKEHIRQLSSLVGGGFDGVWIDYRGIPSDQRDNFSAFIRDLSASFDAVNLTLGVIVPYAENINGVWDTGAYDWRVIGQYADWMQINLPLNPMAYKAGETELVEAMLRWAITEVNRYKLITGLSAESIRNIDGAITPIGYDEGLAGLGDVVVTADNVNENGIVQPNSIIRARLDGMSAIAGVDTFINAPYLDYVDGNNNPVARIWLTTGDALRWRMDSGTRFAIGGVAFDDLLSDDLASEIFGAISTYKAQIPSAPSPTDLALRWRVEGTVGLLQEMVTGIGQELVTTINAPDGNYAVNVAVIGIDEDSDESVRGGAAIAMFAPTPTPTPLPTPTPTPIPTVTPTPAPIVATVAPVGGNNTSPSGNGFGAFSPGAGSIRLGQFEYGGQVTSTGGGRAVDAMRRAGMTWMKMQIRYSPGGSASDVAGVIQGAKSNGFKILLGVVGSPSDVANGGDGYIAGFASWLGTVASMGPDAIEVWNEPNLSREWPEGQISGARYANMLRQAYQAIKRNNPNVIVISAAPGPTGAEAAYPGKVVNDDRWLADFVANGGLSVTDCVGAHYNEGIVPPTQTSGDPRDPYYTRYFPAVVDTYWNIIGGQKPLCFTELGYLTPEGFGVPLDSYFAWAQNVTVSQQAAWLAQAAALSSQSGRVKLMIVWNVDFSNFGTDPMGGYAIIRPDGTCPACDSLAGAR
jgi:hypothetical protein